jgi:hypothetical protein
VASFFPFHATYFLNGHSFMEQELKRNNIGFRKDDNAFLAAKDRPAHQRRLGSLSRHQTPRHTHHPAPGGSPA